MKNNCGTYLRVTFEKNLPGQRKLEMVFGVRVSSGGDGEIGGVSFKNVLKTSCLVYPFLEILLFSLNFL